jgi:hypothetical protein
MSLSAILCMSIAWTVVITAMILSMKKIMSP